MRALFIFILVVSGSHCALAQSSSPKEVIQRQLDAYNARDIDVFMDLFSDDAILINHADGEVLARGRPEIHALYSNLFNQSPKLKSTLVNRMVLGNTVIDHESITGRMGKKDVVELIVIYELQDSKISKVTVIR